MKTLYQHQKDAINAIKNNPKGIIHLPTGTGKSTIIFESIIQKLNEGQKCIAICSPRILLSNQIVQDVFEYLTEKKIPAEYLCIRSGEKVNLVKSTDENGNLIDEEEETDWDIVHPWDKEIQHTTTAKTIIDYYANNVKAKNIPLIISCVYDSVRRLHSAEEEMGLPLVQSIFYDEAHNLCSKEFAQILDWFNGRNAYSFTATLKKTASKNGYGMNNVTTFGNVIYSKSPAEMIKAGIIVRPRIHVVKPENGVLTEKDKLPKNLVMNAFLEHKKALETSNPKKIGAKLLVVCQGSEQLIELFFSLFPEGKEKDERINNVTVFAVGSGIGKGKDIGGCWKITEKNLVNKANNFNMSRKDFLNDLKNLPEEQDAIIFHINILTEGIDVPGITGIMPLRALKLAKFLQNLGRATRLTSDDRTNVRNGKLSTDFEKGYINGELSPEAQKYQKPYAWIVVPWLSKTDTDIEETFKGYIHNLRDFGFLPSEDILEERAGKNEEEPDSDRMSKGLYSPVTGKIKNWLVKEGETVKTGDTIVEFEVENIPVAIPFQIPKDMNGNLFYRVGNGGKVQEGKLFGVVNEKDNTLVGGFGKFLHEIECEKEAIKFWNSDLHEIECEEEAIKFWNSENPDNPWDPDNIPEGNIVTPKALANQMFKFEGEIKNYELVDPYCKSGNMLMETASKGIKVTAICHDEYALGYSVCNITKKKMSDKIAPVVPSEMFDIYKIDGHFFVHAKDSDETINNIGMVSQFIDALKK